jgi:hypothetical protein
VDIRSIEHQHEEVNARGTGHKGDAVLTVTDPLLSGNVDIFPIWKADVTLELTFVVINLGNNKNKYFKLIHKQQQKKRTKELPFAGSRIFIEIERTSPVTPRFGYLMKKSKWPMSFLNTRIVSMPLGLMYFLPTSCRQGQTGSLLNNRLPSGSMMSSTDGSSLAKSKPLIIAVSYRFIFSSFRAFRSSASMGTSAIQK